MYNVSFKKVSASIVLVLILTMVFALFSANIAIFNNVFSQKSDLDTMAMADTVTATDGVDVTLINDYYDSYDTKTYYTEKSTTVPTDTASAKVGCYDDGSGVLQYWNASVGGTNSAGSTALGDTKEATGYYATSYSITEMLNGKYTSSQVATAIANNNLYYKVTFESLTLKTWTENVVYGSTHKGSDFQRELNVTGYDSIKESTDIDTFGYNDNPDITTVCNSVIMAESDVIDLSMRTYAYHSRSGGTGNPKIYLAYGYAVKISVYFDEPQCEFGSSDTNGGGISLTSDVTLGNSIDKGAVFNSFNYALGLNETITLSATTYEGYSFAGWLQYIDGVATSTEDATLTLVGETCLAEDVKIYAIFLPNELEDTYTYNSKSQGPRVERNTSGSMSIKSVFKTEGGEVLSQAPTNAGTYLYAPSYVFDNNIVYAPKDYSFTINKAELNAQNTEVWLAGIYGQTIAEMAVSNFGITVIDPNLEEVTATCNIVSDTTIILEANDTEEPTTTPLTVQVVPDSEHENNFKTVTFDVDAISYIYANVPTIEIAVAQLTYGDSLGEQGITFNATNSKNSALTGVQGTIQWFDNSVLVAEYNTTSAEWSWVNGEVLPSNGTGSIATTPSYDVVFVPDSINYKQTEPQSVELSVAKVMPTVNFVWSELNYGEAFDTVSFVGSTATLGAQDGATAVEGTYSISSNGSVIPTNAEDETVYTATFTPSNSVNYYPYSKDITLIVNKVDPQVVFSYNGDTDNIITFGEVLAYDSGASAINTNIVTEGYSQDVVGAYLWLDSAGEEVDTTLPLLSGEYNFTMAFVPTDSLNYTVHKEDVTITVKKANITLADVSATGIVYGADLTDDLLQGTASFIYNGESIAVQGDFAFDWSDSTFNKYMPAVSNSGKSVAYTFTPQTEATFISDTVEYDLGDHLNVFKGATRVTITKAELAETTVADLVDVNPDVVLYDSLSSATYQVSRKSGKITIVASTSAFTKDSSGTATYVPIVFGVDIGIIATIVNGTYSYKYENGISTTTAEYTINGTAGIVTFTANLDTKYSVNYATINNDTATLAVKSEQTVNGFNDINSVYGGSAIYLGSVSLSSGLKDYTIVSATTDVIAVSDDHQFLNIIGTGETTVTLTHVGTDALAGCQKTVAVVISKADLTITVDSQTICYGDDVTISYTYNGFKNGESATADVVSGLVNDYNGQINSGSYDITPSGAVADNYNITFVAGTLTINKATLTPIFQPNISKEYGDDFPEVRFTYTGYLFEDNKNCITTEPVVDFGTLTAFSAVGVYDITVDATQAEALNYNFDTTVTSTISVWGRAVEINLEATEVGFSGTNATVTADVTGVGEYAPSGTVTYSYTTLGNYDSWVAEAPIQTGVYCVLVTYTANPDGDNYLTTNKEFYDVLTINAVNPIFSVTNNNVVYTGTNAIATANVAGYGDSEPQGTFTVQFQDANGDYSTTAPINVGEYDMLVKYEATADDNYLTYEETATLTITPANATSTLEQVIAVFSGAEVTAGATSIIGLNNVELNQDVDNLDGVVTYNYYVGNELSTSVPTNAGSYNVEVVYTATAGSNYASFATKYYNHIVIKKADIQGIGFVEDTIKEVDYTGADATFLTTDAYVNGIVDAQAPTGEVSFEYILNTSLTGIYSSSAINAGTYNVKVIYTTNASDNYNSASCIVDSKLVINKVLPTITMSYFDSYVYNGSGYSVNAVAVGVEGGASPEGSFTYMYKAVDADTYTKDLPYNAGVYSVQTTFTATNSGNYLSIDGVTEFVGIMTISAKKPTFTIDYVTEEVSENPVTTTAYIVGADDNNPIAPKGSISYTYYLNGKVCEAPILTGSYDVKVTYSAINADGVAETNYQNSSTLFEDVIVIINIAPTISLESKETEYTGASIEANAPTIDITFGDYFGTMSAEYFVQGAWTTTAPINTGVYNVKINYTQADVDNYRSTSVVFKKALTITKKTVVVTPDSNQAKGYDGNSIDMSSITYYSDIELASGNRFTGSLEVSDANAVGMYEIALGTLSAGINYKISFTKGVYYSIDKKEISLVFPTLENNIYDGTAKAITITYSADSLVFDTDVINVYTTLVGDTINVGEFTAVASLNSTNYTLPADCSMVYEILPATMANNVFEDKTASYTGKAINMVMDSVEEGAVVSYNTATQYVSVGEHKVEATVTKANYKTETLTATLTITKGKLDVVVTLQKDSYTFGDALPVLNVSTKEGVATLDEGQTLVAGNNSYKWTFVPNNANTYEVVKGAININVVKAKVDVIFNGNLTQNVGDTNDLEVLLSGVSNESSLVATVSYVDTKTGDVLENKPTKEGTYTVVVTYKGDANYESLTTTATLVIEKPQSFLWIYIAVAVLVVASIVGGLIASKKNMK